MFKNLAHNHIHTVECAQSLCVSQFVSDNGGVTSTNDLCMSLQKGFIWTEIKQMWDSGFQDYIEDWWNLMDFIMNSLYIATISLKIVAYVKVL